jgi:hypothetical protein
MAEEGFLRRWARRKSEVLEGRTSLAEPSAESAPATPLAVPAAEVQVLAADAMPQSGAAPSAEAVSACPLPTMDDVATLDKDSDFSAFVARGVDQAVRRSALKKLFADPHFNVMDKLDVYIDDYTKPSPVSEAMLASLEHAKSVFMKMVEEEPEAPEALEATEQEPKKQTQQPPEQETQ